MAYCYSYIDLEGIRRDITYSFNDFGGDYLDNYAYDLGMIINHGCRSWIKIGYGIGYPGSSPVWAQLYPHMGTPTTVPVGTVLGTVYTPVIAGSSINAPSIGNPYTYVDQNGINKQVDLNTLINAGTWSSGTLYSIPEYVSSGSWLFLALGSNVSSEPSFGFGPDWSELEQIEIPVYPSNDAPPIYPPTAPLDAATYYAYTDANGRTVQIYGSRLNYTGGYSTGTAYSTYDVVLFGSGLYVANQSLNAGVSPGSTGWSDLVAVLSEPTGTQTYPVSAAPVSGGTNIGGGVGVYASIANGRIIFKSLESGYLTSITDNGDTVLIESTIPDYVVSEPERALFAEGTINDSLNSLYVQLGTAIEDSLAGDEYLQYQVGTLNTGLDAATAGILAESEARSTNDSALWVAVGTVNSNITTERLRAMDAENAAMTLASQAENDAQDASALAYTLYGSVVGGAPDPFNTINSVAASIGYDPHFNLTVGSLIQAAVDSILGFAPATLDTMQEVAAAINNDPAFYQDILSVINTKLGTAGGTLTGDLYLYETCTLPMQAAPKIYVDTVMSTFIGTVIAWQTALTETGIANAAAITTETNRAILAEGSLQNQIDAETVNRENADSALSVDIVDVTNALNAEIARAITAEGTNAAAIAYESETRSSEDSALEYQIGTLNSTLSQEIDRAIAAEGTNAAENTALEYQIGTLNASILNESSRAVLSEGSNAAAIVTEAYTRSNADLVLETQIGTLNNLLQTAFYDIGTNNGSITNNAALIQAVLYQIGTLNGLVNSIIQVGG